MDPVEFDASRLQGVTATQLTSLMNLTFIGDEKLASNPLFPRPPSPVKITSSDADGRRKFVELESKGLEKQLDEEMARSLAEDNVATDDHNADKKFGSQTDGFDGTVMTPAGATHRAAVAGTAVKSLSNTAALSQSYAVRDDQQHYESTVDSHSTPGLSCTIIS